jgi:hypothetical protein
MLASHRGRCEHGGSDQSCRQQLDGGHRTSPLGKKSQVSLAYPNEIGPSRGF